MNMRHRQKGYWREIEHVKTETVAIMQKHALKEMPSRNWLRENGYKSMVDVIQSHGGFYALREKLGQQQKRTKHGQLKDLAYVLETIQHIMKENELKKVPISQWFSTHGYSSLSNAISKYHGGFSAIRLHLGEKTIQVKKGTWKNIDFTIQQMQEVMKKHNLKQMPSSDWLENHKYHSISLAIQKYHGGYFSFRKRIGEENSRVPDGTWKDLEYTLQQAEQIMQTHGLEQFPTQRWLQKNKYASLCIAINKYHGGLQSFLKELHQRLGVKDNAQKLEDLLNEYAA